MERSEDINKIVLDLEKIKWRYFSGCEFCQVGEVAMYKYLFKILVALFSVGMIATVLAQDHIGDPVPLCDSDCGKIKPEARSHYKKALDYLDRIYLEGALEELRKAAELDPNHPNLQFFLAALARQLGQLATTPDPTPGPPPDPMYYNAPPPTYFFEFPDPLKYYTIAENALLNVQKIENLTKDQRVRLETGLKQIHEEKAGISQRDAQRKKVGYEKTMGYLSSIGWVGVPSAEEGAASSLTGIGLQPPVSSTTTAGVTVPSKPSPINPELVTSAPAKAPAEATPASPFISSGTAVSPAVTPSATPSAPSPFAIGAEPPPKVETPPVPTATPAAPSAPIPAAGVNPFI